VHGTFFYIGLGAGLAAACGLRPFLPLLLAGALGSAGTLGVRFSHGAFHFLAQGWWLATVAAVLAVSYLLQLRLGARAGERGGVGERSGVGEAGGGAVGRGEPLQSALTGLALGAGALLFAGTLAAHHDAWWPGIVGGLAAALLAQMAVGPVIEGARARLADRAAREALTVYLDAAAVLLAVLVAVLHPLGYVALALLAWFWARRRRRAGERYAGLRILRR
jgi:hypothetical protein